MRNEKEMALTAKGKSGQQGKSEVHGKAGDTGSIRQMRK